MATLVWKRSAQKALMTLEPRRAEAIDNACKAIAQTPPPVGRHRNVIALSGVPGGYRLRVGDWRVSFVVDTDRDVVQVFEVAPRGSAYRWR